MTDAIASHRPRARAGVRRGARRPDPRSVRAPALPATPAADRAPARSRPRRDADDGAPRARGARGGGPDLARGGARNVPADRGPSPIEHPRRSAMTARSDDVGPADVMAARRLIEPQVLPLVVAWATTRDFDEMRRCLDGGAAAASAEEFEVWDFALHHAIVAAGRNQLVLRMYERGRARPQGRDLGQPQATQRLARAARRSTRRDHLDLVEALARSGARARGRGDGRPPRPGRGESARGRRDGGDRLSR